MRKSILSINGNKSMNFLLQTVLSTRYNLIPVSDVFQGMNELKRNPEIELIIIDVDYNSQENADFIQHIKTSGLYQGTPIVALTSNDKVQNNPLLAIHVNKFFHKPFSPQEMEKNIFEMLYAPSANVI